jgi:hypothetical protein
METIMKFYTLYENSITVKVERVDAFRNEDGFHALHPLSLTSAERRKRKNYILAGSDLEMKFLLDSGRYVVR